MSTAELLFMLAMLALNVVAAAYGAAYLRWCWNQVGSDNSVIRSRAKLGLPFAAFVTAWATPTALFWAYILLRGNA